MEIKKILAGLLASAVTVGMLAVPAFADFETVEKASADENFEEVTAALSEDAALEISNAEELAAFASDVNAGNTYAGKKVILTNDIDLAAYDNWESIGKRNTAVFSGEFDGNGKTIYNLKLSGAGGQAGFFGKTTGGKTYIHDFTIDGAEASFGYMSANHGSAIVIGEAFTGKMENVHVKNANLISYATYTGGLIGHGYMNITNCSFQGNIKCYAPQVGGIAGSGGFTVKNCSFIGDIHGDTWVGGIIGNCQDGGAYTDCYVKGNVSANYAYAGVSAAGIAAIPLYTSQKIEGCYNDATITCNDEPVPCPIIGGYNAEVTKDTVLSISGNSWNREIHDMDSFPIIGEGGDINNPVKSEERNNTIVVNESDIKYVGNVEDAVIKNYTNAASTVTPEDIENNSVADVNGKKYTNLVEAVAAALVSGENETVTMLCNANGDGIIIPAGANITIDFGGYSYTIDGTLVGSKGSETNGFQLLKDANVTLKNGTIISSKLAKWGPNTPNAANATGANIVIQNYSNLRLENITIDGDQSAVTEGNPSAAYARYVLSNNNGNTVLTGNTNIIAAPGNYAFDVYGGWYPAYPSVTVTLDENMTGTITGKIQVSNGEVAKPDNFKLSIKNGTIDGTIQDDRSAAQKETYPKLNAVSGGSFTTDVSDYCEDGFAPRFVNGKYVVGEDNSATTIKLIFKQPDANDNTLYNIVLSGVEKNINRLNAAEFKFALTTTDAITYEIAAADGLALIPQADGMYEFHFDGKDFTGGITDTGAEIVIGTVKFEGYGKFTFFAETGRATATTTEDNLVTEFVVTETDGKGMLVIGEDENKINTEIKVPKQILTINIAMNHPVTDNATAYQDMKVVISGGDLAGETLTFDLGTNGKYLVNGAYNFGVELTQNRLYTVTVSGAGYRTARYTVAMTEDKTMNFWNNVMSNEITVVDDVKDTVNFLAGDIVKDGKINIYDLSAVVAYFGTENNQAEYSKFAKYDLNRDGKIDMMDISIVLTSWGK